MAHGTLAPRFRCGYDSNTMTLTLEIPDDLAPHLSALPENLRHNFALAAMRTMVLRTPIAEPEHVLTPDQLARLGKSLAQADAGELIDGDEVMAELYAEAGLENPPVFNRDNPRLSPEAQARRKKATKAA